MSFANISLISELLNLDVLPSARGISVDPAPSIQANNCWCASSRFGEPDYNYVRPELSKRRYLKGRTKAVP